MTAPRDMRPQRVEGVLRRDLPSGECMLLEPQAALALVLNPVGAAIWDLCDGTRSLTDMASLLVEHFAETALEQVQADVQALVKQLIDTQMLRDPDSCGNTPSQR
jgi:hypothetical protein